MNTLGPEKPVLVLAPRDGEAVELLTRAGTAVWADPEDSADVARKLIALEDRWEQSNLRVRPDETFIQTMTRSYLTGCLAQVFDEVAGLLIAEQADRACRWRRFVITNHRVQG